MLRIAIVEDEERFADELSHFCRRFAGEKREEIRTVVFHNAFDFLDQYHDGFDLVFMDIAMPMMDGMECARRLRKVDEGVMLIFVTSMAQYAIKGYEVGAFDFMVKPVAYPAASLKLERALRQLNKRQAALYPVSCSQGVVVLEIPAITYIEVYNHTLIFHTLEKSYETYGKLSTLEADSRFASFFKTGKSHLVNCLYIKEIGDNTLTVGGNILPLARRRRKECLEKMAAAMGGMLR